MSITAKFYNFSKRRNSTQVVSGDGWETQVDLKSTTSLLRPVFLLAADNVNYNYVEYNGRYYWIDDIRSVRNGVWSIECSVDVLATYRSNILATNAFVLRSESDYNIWQSDNLYIPDADFSVSSAVQTFSSLSDNDYYIVALVGNNSGGDSAVVSYYYLTPSGMSSLMNSIFSPDGIQALTAYFSNIKDALVGGFITPIRPTSVQISTEDIHIGNYDTGVTGSLITNGLVLETVTFTIPWQTSDFRRTEPYTTIALTLPFVGTVKIMPENILTSSTLSVQGSFDTVGMEYAFAIRADDRLIDVYSGNMGVTIPLAGITNNVGGLVSSLTGAATAGIALANPLVALGGLAIGGTISRMSHGFSIIGNMGGRAKMEAINPIARLDLYYHDSDPGILTSTQGRVLNQGVQIGNLSGYVITRDFSVSGTMTETEKNEINTLMNGGVFIE